MNVLILEDSLAYALDYEMILEKLGLNLLGVHKSSLSALNSLKKSIPDLMIVDIFLEGKDRGFDFIEEVKNYKIPFIVCSGYPEPQFMDIAFNLGAAAFFSKPLDKAALTYEIKRLVAEIANRKGREENMIVKYKGSLVKVPHSEIRRVDTEGNYSYVFVDNNKKYIIKLSLKKILSKMNNAAFVQCNRSCIVNLDWIERVDAYNKKVVMKTGESLVLGRTYRKSLIEAFS